MSTGAAVWRVCVLAVALAGCVPTSAHKRVPYYRQTQVDVGVTRGSDVIGFEGASTASGTGLRLTEVNGAISKTVLIAAVIGFLAMFDNPDRGTKVEFIDRTVMVKDDNPLSKSGYKNMRERGIKVTAKPFTPEELAAHQAKMDSVSGMFAMFPMHTEVAYYPQRDNGELHGYAVSAYLIAAPLGRYVELATGYYFQNLSAEVTDMETQTLVRRSHRARGIPARLTLQPVAWFSLHAELLFNMRAFDDEASGERTHGARLGGAFALPWMQRIYGRLGVERNRLGTTDGAWGTTAELGVRF